MPAGAQEKVVLQLSFGEEKSFQPLRVDFKVVRDTKLGFEDPALKVALVVRRRYAAEHVHVKLSYGSTGGQDHFTLTKASFCRQLAILWCLQRLQIC